MSLSQIFNIFQKPQYDETIQKVETRTYQPYVKSFNNNDVIEISINQSDQWILMSDAALIIEGKIKTEGTGEASLVNNAGAFFFDSITYDLNGQEVESVRDPGILSTIKGYMCYNTTDSKHLDIAGWNFPSNPIINKFDNSFVFRIPLKHLLGIFNDYQYVFFGKQTIRLVRARHDKDALLIEKADDTFKVEIKIENIVLRVDIMIPNDVLKLNLLESVKKDTPIIIPFRKWEYHELPQLTTGATKEIWSVKTCTALESPRYIIIAFQEARRGDLKKNTSKFDNIEVSDIRVTLNGDYYPIERMRLDFSKNKYVEAHCNYTKFYQSFKNDYTLPKQPLLDYVTFKTHALFVIDCSRRIDALKSSTVDVKVDMEAQTGFPINTKAYCIIIHDAIIEHLPLSEIVRKLS